MDIVVVSDGSRDGTAEVARRYSGANVRVVELPRNVGKAGAQNEAVAYANGEILVFSDADVSLPPGALRRMVRHFDDEAVGCVTGRVAYTNHGQTNVTRGEGVHWGYEVSLREAESRIGNLVAGSGALIAVRRALFEPLDAAVSEDFFLPMRAAIRGYRTRYEPEAVAATPLRQARPRDMFRTRMRTTMLDTRSVWLCRAILNPARYPLYALGLVSHKLLRWLVPYVLLALLAINVALRGQPLYDLVLALQLAFYLVAVTGYVCERQGRWGWWLALPFTFCLVNAAALVGVARFLGGRTSAKWTPVR